MTSPISSFTHSSVSSFLPVTDSKSNQRGNNASLNINYSLLGNEKFDSNKTDTNFITNSMHLLPGASKDPSSHNEFLNFESPEMNHGYSVDSEKVYNQCNLSLSKIVKSINETTSSDAMPSTSSDSNQKDQVELLNISNTILDSYSVAHKKKFHYQRELLQQQQQKHSLEESLDKIYADKDNCSPAPQLIPKKDILDVEKVFPLVNVNNSYFPNLPLHHEQHSSSTIDALDKSCLSPKDTRCDSDHLSIGDFEYSYDSALIRPCNVSKSYSDEHHQSYEFPTDYCHNSTQEIISQSGTSEKLFDEHQLPLTDQMLDPHVYSQRTEICNDFSLKYTKSDFSKLSGAFFNPLRYPNFPVDHFDKKDDICHLTDISGHTVVNENQQGPSNSLNQALHGTDGRISYYEDKNSLPTNVVNFNIPNSSISNTNLSTVAVTKPEVSSLVTSSLKTPSKLFDSLQYLGRRSSNLKKCVSPSIMNFLPETLSAHPGSGVIPTKNSDEQSDTHFPVSKNDTSSFNKYILKKSSHDTGNLLNRTNTDCSSPPYLSSQHNESYLNSFMPREPDDTVTNVDDINMCLNLVLPQYSETSESPHDSGQTNQSILPHSGHYASQSSGGHLSCFNSSMNSGLNLHGQIQSQVHHSVNPSFHTGNFEDIVQSNFPLYNLSSFHAPTILPPDLPVPPIYQSLSNKSMTAGGFFASNTPLSPSSYPINLASDSCNNYEPQVPLPTHTVAAPIPISLALPPFHSSQLIGNTSFNANHSAYSCPTNSILPQSHPLHALSSHFYPPRSPPLLPSHLRHTSDSDPSFDNSSTCRNPSLPASSVLLSQPTPTHLLSNILSMPSLAHDIRDEHKTASSTSELAISEDISASTSTLSKLSSNSCISTSRQEENCHNSSKLSDSSRRRNAPFFGSTSCRSSAASSVNSKQTKCASVKTKSNSATAEIFSCDQCPRDFRSNKLLRKHKVGASHNLQELIFFLMGQLVDCKCVGMYRVRLVR